MKTITKLSLAVLLVGAYAAFNSAVAQKYKFKTSLFNVPSLTEERTKKETLFTIDFDRKKFDKSSIISEIKIKDYRDHQDPKYRILEYNFEIEDGYSVWLTIAGSEYYDELFLYDKDLEGMASVRYYGKVTEIKNKVK